MEYARDIQHRGEGLELLQQAQACYAALARYRRDRNRCKLYAAGDQWSDKVIVDGEAMTEEEYLRRQGCQPLKNNHVVMLLHKLVGIYRQQDNVPSTIARDRDEQIYGEMMSELLKYNGQLNNLKELNARSLHEFVMSGLVVQRKSYYYRGGMSDCWTEVVRPNDFFIDPGMRDYNGRDCTMIGEVHNISFQDLTRQFAKTPGDYAALKEMFKESADPNAIRNTWTEFGYSDNSIDVSFLVGSDPGRCKVIEIWRKESRPRWRCHDWLTGELFKCEFDDYPQMVQMENAKRLMQNPDAPLIQATWMIDDAWFYYYVTPLGHILSHGESPYAHGEHPYVFKAYPFVDGEIHSLVGDVIDQQKYINRLVSLHDMIMRASAKGVLMIPRDSLGGLKVEDFVKAWSMPNGVVVYEPSASGERPVQMATNSSNVGIDNLLNYQLKFFEDISGVQGALQGKAGFAGMSASLYQMQTQNATTNILDPLESFSSFALQGARKDVYNMRQFYDEGKVRNILGRNYTLDNFDFDKFQNVDFDFSIVNSQDTPIYRSINNEMLMTLFQGGQITLEEMLETGSFPFADNLLRKVSARKEEEAKMAQQAAMQQAEQVAVQGAQGGAPQLAEGPIDPRVNARAPMAPAAPAADPQVLPH